jgi:hypothetical protein
MADISTDLLERLPIDRIAEELGVTRQEVEDSIAVGAPTLLQGMNAEAHSSPEKAQSLLKALAEDHDGGLLDDPDPMARVDVNEGEKILQHIFGSNEGAVADRLGAAGTNQAGSSLFSKILPMIAPFVMSWLSRKMGGRVKGTEDAEGGLGGVLGDLLGGGSTSEQGGGLGDMLGDALSGGGDGSSGGLGDLLGGMLGGSGKGASEGGGLGGLVDIIGGLAGSSGAGRDIPDVGDLLNSRG